MGTRSIQTLSVSDVEVVLRKAFRGTLDVDAIQDVIASVDWSGVNLQKPSIANSLGELENLTTMLTEGDITDAKYRAAIQELFPGITQTPTSSR